MPQQFARYNAYLIAGDILQSLPVRREYLGRGDIADIASVLVHHWQVPGSGPVKLIHHTVHTISGQDCGGSVLHQGIKLGRIVLVLVEHYLSDIIQTDVATIDTGIVQNRVQIACRTCHSPYQIAQSILQPYIGKICLNQVRGLQKGK